MIIKELYIYRYTICTYINTILYIPFFKGYIMYTVYYIVYIYIYTACKSMAQKKQPSFTTGHRSTLDFGFLQLAFQLLQPRKSRKCISWI